MMTELQCTAYHEAGHAAIGYAFGWNPRTVSVHDFNNGAVSSACHWMPSFSEVVHHMHALIAAAGPAAENKFRQQKGFAASAIGHEHDLHFIDVIAGAAAKKHRKDEQDPEAFKRMIWRDIESIMGIDQIWKGVSDVAEEICKSANDPFKLDGNIAARLFKAAGIGQKRIKRGMSIFPLYTRKVS